LRIPTRRTALAIGTGALLALGLAACSNPGGGTTSSAGSAPDWPSATHKLTGTTLTIWAAQASNKEAASVIKGFEKATGATVKVTTIPDPYEQGVQTKVATGDKPDLAFWQPTDSELNELNPATNLQSLDGAPWAKQYTGNLATLAGLKGKTRYAALVTAPAVEGVYYNKQAFAKAGITSTPKNFAEMIADAKILKAKGTTPFYDIGKDQWATQYWIGVQTADAAKKGLWARVSQNKEKFTDPTILGAIKNYDGLIKQGLFNSDIKSGTFVDQGQALLSGKAAMAVQVNALFNEMQASASAKELNQKIGFFPISPSGNVGTYIPDETNALVAFKSGDTAREAAARQFLAYWMGAGYPDFVKSQSTVSIEKGVSTPADVPQALRDVAASLPDAAGSMQALAVANPDLYINLADMIQGTKTPEQVAQTTQAQFAQLATAQGAKGF
jgi:raffinose/stachyose/melibiose transport system substrate-binding protein